MEDSADKTATMIIIDVDGTRRVRSFDPKEEPDLRVLQEAVGGLIQPVDQYMPSNKRAYCNEEGLLLGLPPNPEGTKAVNWPAGQKDFFGGTIGELHGPIVVLEGFALDEDEEDDEE